MPIHKEITDYTSPRGIKKSKLSRRGLKYLTENETAKLCKKNYKSILIPYYDMDGKPIMVHDKPYGRFRVLPKKRFGTEVQPKPKFLQPKNTPNRFFFDREYKRWRKLAKDIKMPVIITEGEFKAMAAIDFGFVTIGIGGVWSWRTRINGTTQPIEDFELMDWKKREVYTCFDSDLVDNPQVQYALNELSYELQRRGAKVYNIELIANKKNEKLGLDDFLVKHGAKEFQKLIDAAETLAIEPVIRKLNSEYAFILTGGKGAVLKENEFDIDNEWLFPSFELFTKSSMQDYFMNKSRVKIGKDKTMNVFDYWLQHPARREYKGIVFNPDHDVLDYYNLWKGFICGPKKGKWDLFRGHILKNICNGDREQFDYTMSWMADAIQNISDKPGVAYVMRGGKGTGKGVFASHFGALFGIHFSAFYQASHITGKFNAHLRDKLLVFADEAFWAGDKQGESVLKGLITEDTTNIEFKGRDTFKIKNMVRLMIGANSEWVIPASNDERRYFVVDVGKEHQQDHDYFEAIEDQMNAGGYEALLYYLLNYDLGGVNLRDVPVTEALIEQKELSMNTFHQFWQQKLLDGWLETHKHGWGTGVVRADILYDQYLNHCKEVNERYPHSQVWFGRAVATIVNHSYKRVRMTQHSKRFWGYNLPNLKKCREYFDEFLGMESAWDE